MSGPRSVTREAAGGAALTCFHSNPISYVRPHLILRNAREYMYFREWNRCKPDAKADLSEMLQEALGTRG